MKRLLRLPWVIAVAMAITAFLSGLFLLVAIIQTILIAISPVDEAPWQLIAHLTAVFLWIAGLIFAWCYWKLVRHVFGIFWNSAVFPEVSALVEHQPEVLNAERRP